MEKLKGSEVRVAAVQGEISVARDENGVPHVRAGSFPDLLFGLGWVTAIDRGVQLELTRLVAKGVTAEYLKPDPEMVELDKSMRRYNIWGDSKYQAECLRPETRELVDAYCAGVNHAVRERRRPLEFRLLKHSPEEWTAADSIAVLKLTGLVDMTETQGWAEKLIIQMIREGADLERMKELFPYMIEDLNPDYVNLICNLKFTEPIVPETVAWAQLPRTMCSNNWAVAGSRTASGRPILAGDPHLDVSRLPAIWQEVVLETAGFYFAGVAIPGIPFPGLGRTRDLAWSATYAFADVMDYFVEVVRDGRYRRGSEWRDFDVRDEVIKRKGGEELVFRYYETDHGVLEGDPSEDGYFLCFAWSAGRDCGAESLDAMAEIMRCARVEEAMPHFARLDFAAFNWVMADSSGNIGYQMSGRCPVRAEGCSGLLPMPGWDPSFHWQGYVPRDDLPSLYNPPEGYIVTANQDLNRHGGAPVQNLCMASYRADRISELLASRSDYTAEMVHGMHYDLFSKQAEAFMPLLRPLLPETHNGQLLREWDLCYSPESMAATLFERFYSELMMVVFGEDGLGRPVMDYLLGETIIFNDFYGNFDHVLLQRDALWFGEHERLELLQLALDRSLEASAVPYNSWRKVLMKNIFFGGRLPRWMGFDYGQIELIGCRATIPQGQIFQSVGRVATYAPALKFTADFAEEGIRSVLAGGPSDRRFSSWYTSGIKDWLGARYKHLCPYGMRGFSGQVEQPKTFETHEEDTAKAGFRPPAAGRYRHGGDRRNRRSAGVIFQGVEEKGKPEMEEEKTLSEEALGFGCKKAKSRFWFFAMYLIAWGLVFLVFMGATVGLLFLEGGLKALAAFPYLVLCVLGLSFGLMSLKLSLIVNKGEKPSFSGLWPGTGKAVKFLDRVHHLRRHRRHRVPPADHPGHLPGHQVPVLRPLHRGRGRPRHGSHQEEQRDDQGALGRLLCARLRAAAPESASAACSPWASACSGSSPPRWWRTDSAT